MYYLIPRPRRVLLFTIAYLLFFVVLAIHDQNFEFLFYTGVMLALIWLAIDIYHRVRLDKWIVFSLSLLGLLHLAGGNLLYRGQRLYDIVWFREPFLLRYDNIVHFFGTFILTFLVYNLVEPIVHLHLRKRKRLVFMGMLILMAMGAGSLNEIMEFIAVLAFDAADKVGDYDNNARDLVFNLLGSLLATAMIYGCSRSGRKE